MSKLDFHKALSIDPKRQEQVERVLSYLDKAFSSGTLNLFYPLVQTDYRILVYLEKCPGAQPSFLADALNVTRPNIAANLRLLDEKKYVVRKLDESNHRQIHVYLTEEGRRHLERVRRKLNFLFASWLEILGEEEIQHLLRILEVSVNPEIVDEDLRKFSLDD